MSSCLTLLTFRNALCLRVTRTARSLRRLLLAGVGLCAVGAREGDGRALVARGVLLLDLLLELELELALCEDDFDFDEEVFDEEDSSGCALYQVSECTVDGEVDSVLSASATETSPKSR